MKLMFEPDLQYQQDAIKSITDLFKGQPICNMEDFVLEFDSVESNHPDLINSVSNNLVLSEEQIFQNLKTIQQDNDIQCNNVIQRNNNIKQNNGIEVATTFNGMNFSVEMETGTGKTYVYLRTIYELNKLYGFKKFVIVVPSIAIREGVKKNLEITHQHFQDLYDNVPVNFTVYDSSKVSALRGFATNNNVEILVINIDSFAKDENIINKPNDRLNGQNPIKFIQVTNPFVIVDEPQNMDTEKRQKAIQGLKPLCTIAYSATHKFKHNLTYSLNPVKSYDLGLVKQIEVDSIVEENAFNDAFIFVEAITPFKTKITAKLTINCNENGYVKKKSVTVKVGDDLYKLSNERDAYASGYLIEEIDASNQCISISNGNLIYQGSGQGGMADEIMKFQIRRTIEEHLKKELQLNKLGIKVLSLFFIDRVANYRSYTVDGTPIKGKFAQWFEEIYTEYIKKPAFKELDKFNLEDIHNGYFSQDAKAKLKDTNGRTKADDDTYNLIMKDKEKLLSLDSSLRFIFSHSALREGWDNPNVFQICTLNETKSEIKKRQELGRGLRLCVDQTGKRVYDSNLNRLTVIANESYEDFAKSLQKEIEEDCGVEFSGRIKKLQDRTKINYRKGFEVDPRFLEIWERIKNRTSYRVNYDTNKLINAAIEELKKLPPIQPASVRSTKTGIKMTKDGIDGFYIGEKVESCTGGTWIIPNLLIYIQNKTELTRSTIKKILDGSGRIEEFLINPQLFLDLSSQAINKVRQDLMIDGIKYQKIAGNEYKMTLFESSELGIYLNEFSFKVTDTAKTIYEEFMPLDSGVENIFARDCETSEQVKFYFKLPSGFKIPTPLGEYNPDWALVLENDNKIYFVAETKDTGATQVGLSQIDLYKLRTDERMKIECGKAHFKEFNDVEYKVVSKVGQLIELQNIYKKDLLHK